jgi:peptide/nickel transport system permease protein
VRRFLLLRLVGLVGVLLASSFIIYGALFLAPGSPESVLIGGRSVSPATVAAIRAEYHLDSPFLVSYVQWLAGVLHGDLGRSLSFRQDVAGLVWSRIPTTLALTLYASLIIVFWGVALGVLAAVRGGRLDRGVLIGTSLAAATPSFVAAIGLITVFAVKLRWLPVFGAGSGIADRIEHLTLPAIALAFAWIGLLGRVTRSAMIDQLGREHVETARSRGIPEIRLVLRHGLRNALVPISTIAGLAVAGLLSGAVIVEDAFGLNGLGSLLLQSVLAKDFPVVQAICLILVAAFVVVNTVVDGLYGVIDPRLADPERRGR